MTRLALALSLALGLAGPALGKELPRPKAEEPKKDTACAYLGEGYAKVPGSDTCIKVGGSVRVESATTFGR